jgi:hypothetical protein
MKKAIIIIVGILLTLPARSQVADSIIYKQLNLAGFRAQRTANAGVSLTCLGAIGMTAGILIDRKVRETGNGIAGLVVAEAGFCMFCTGVPLWMISVSKMNDIEIEMIKYQGTVKGPGIGLKIKF